MAFQPTFNRIKAKIASKDPSVIDGFLAVQINLTGKSEGIFYVEIKDGVLSVEPYEYYDRQAIITVSAENLTKMLNEKLDPVAAFTQGKLKVEGDLSRALELMKIIK